jgi:quercetin dioxygenase-like cupin family protein
MDHVNAPKERAARQRIETFSHSSGAVAELLTTGILKKKMMPVLLKIKPKGHTEKEEHPPFSERFAYVLKGTMEIIFGKDKKTLVEGEGLYFDSSLPHTFKNLSSSECWCLSVVTPPSL